MTKTSMTLDRVTIAAFKFLPSFYWEWPCIPDKVTGNRAQDTGKKTFTCSVALSPQGILLSLRRSFKGKTGTRGQGLGTRGKMLPPSLAQGSHVKYY